MKRILGKNPVLLVVTVIGLLQVVPVRCFVTSVKRESRAWVNGDEWNSWNGWVPRRSPFRLSARYRPDTNKRKDDNNKKNNGGGGDDGGLVGSGPNWIERSFPVETDGKTNADPKKVIDYNVGIHGASFEVGALSERMYGAIVSRSSLVRDGDRVPEDLERALKIYALDFTAKEAVRAALEQNGLQMVLTDDEQDEGMWSDVDSIRIQNDGAGGKKMMYDSWEDVVDVWKPGQNFDFVARQVPAKMKELSLEELLQALDPDGSLRREAKESGIKMPDEIDDDDEKETDDSTIDMSLEEIASENVRRTEAPPREAVAEGEAFAGRENNRGYRVIQANNLKPVRHQGDGDATGGEDREKHVFHVMDALVSHGCLVVDITNGGTSPEDARTMSQMWTVTRRFFEEIASDEALRTSLPGMHTAEETGSHHAKVGYGNYNGGNLQFLETRFDRGGNFLPADAADIIERCGRKDDDDDIDGTDVLRRAFDVVAGAGKDIVRIAVAASTREANTDIGTIDASEAALLLADELVDCYKPIRADIDHSEGSVSMSPLRLCRYANENNNRSDDDDGEQTTREVFGAHTDSTFMTAVPVAAVSGLEVFDEAEERWYRPELAARKHWEATRASRGEDPAASSDDVDGVDVPWHARYVAYMPGELLQVATRNEICAAVHRVVATQNSPCRYSAPILLRGRSGTVFDAGRYLCGTGNSHLLRECDGMTIEQIHDAMQPTPFE